MATVYNQSLSVQGRKRRRGSDTYRALQKHSIQIRYWWLRLVWMVVASGDRLDLQSIS